MRIPFGSKRREAGPAPFTTVPMQGPHPAATPEMLVATRLTRAGYGRAADLAASDNALLLLDVLTSALREIEIGMVSIALGHPDEEWRAERLRDAFTGVREQIEGLQCSLTDGMLPAAEHMGAEAPSD